jgi:hypothetical protein
MTRKSSSIVVSPSSTFRKPSSNIVVMPSFLASFFKLSKLKSGLIINFRTSSVMPRT